MLITLNDIAFSYGDNLILNEVNFAINEGERVGLIGANGEGKTTLIKLILGQLDPSYGSVITKNGIRIGYLEQNGGYSSGATVYEEMNTVFAKQHEALERLSVLSSQLAECDYHSKDYSQLSAKLEAVNKYISANDCYNIDVKIKTVLNGMGFENFYQRVIDTLSGGEKTRLKLARLLLESPDLLILDEPTNHLDIKTLYWLEDYLQTFKGAVFVVSHDRYFLDRIITKTLEIEDKHIASFNGNYSKYKILKAEKVALEQKEYEKQQEEIEKLQTYVDKNIVRATTAKSAQSRVKQLDKMQLLKKPYVAPKPPKFTFTYDTKPYERVLTITNLHLKNGQKHLIDGGNLSLLRGQKMAIVGDNGAGKSTLLKHIVYDKDPAVDVGRFVHFAVYDQENANLDGENTVLEEMWNRHVAYTQTEVRAALASCGLFPEDMQKQVKCLSGGERAKLALCVFESECGNVLVLDEPTNHLDLPARESLEDALKTFDGTVIFVSHDRYFISGIADCVAEIEDGKLNYYSGGYESYKQQKADEKLEQDEKERLAEQKKYEENKAASYRSRKERAEEARKKERIKAIEADISACEQQEEQLNAQLSDPNIAADYIKVQDILQKLEQLRAKQTALYDEYETLI
jgi:ATP-binding cassette subfamily F protein 3